MGTVPGTVLLQAQSHWALPGRKQPCLALQHLKGIFILSIEYVN